LEEEKVLEMVEIVAEALKDPIQSLQLRVLGWHLAMGIAEPSIVALHGIPRREL